VKIMDFGIARVRGAEHLTNDGFMMGTPAYMPPEQVLGNDVDGRADLYSVGVMLYRLLTGALPFQADTAIGMVQKQISDPPTPLYLYRDGLPDWCEAILQRALAKSPDDRFQTAEEFRAAIARATGVVSHDLTAVLSAADLEVTPPPRSAAVARAMALATAARRLAFRAAPPVSAAKAPAAGEGATVVLKRKHFALAGSMIAIGAVGVGVLAFVALRRPEPAPAALAAESTMPADVVLAAAPAAPAPETAKPPTPTSLPTVDRTAAETLENPVNAASSSSAPITERPPMAFDAKALVGAGQRQRERDAQLLLADGKVTITADNKDILHSVPYSGVVSVSYSRGRDPLWNSPQGPAPVARMSGGAFGFIRGERHWIALRTKDHFFVLRLQDVQVNQVLGALAERTGRSPERVVERKAAK